jgi:hypothetical protein
MKQLTQYWNQKISNSYDIDNNPDLVDDALLWDIWLSRLYLPALAVADTLQFFSLIADGYNTINSLADHLDVAKAGVEALVYFLLGLELLDVDVKNSHILRLTTIANRYLLPNSSFYWGYAFVRSHHTEEYKRIFKAITDQPKLLHSHGKDLSNLWQQGELDDETAQLFTKIMHSTIHQAAVSAVASNAFKHVKNLFDIGGGSGCFAQAFVNKYPKSQATIFELPSVCKILNDTLSKEISNNQIKLHIGNFFIDKIPTGHDGILLSNILHDWQIPQVEFLLQQSCQALDNGGTIFIHEMLLDDVSDNMANSMADLTKYASLTVTAFNLLMYVNHGSQQFTIQQITNLLEKAGFSDVKLIKTHTYYSLISATKI